MQSRRDRSKNDAVQSAAIYRHVPDPERFEPSDGSDVQVPFLKGSEFQSMIDTSGFPWNWMNPCQHTKFEGSFDVYLPESINGQALGWDTFQTPPGRAPKWELVQPIEGATFYNYCVDRLPQPPASLLYDLAAKAEDEFISATQSNGSIINFILELIQVLEGNMKIAIKLVDIWNKMLEAFKEAMKRYAGHPDQLWLAWSFAVKPTIQDIKNLVSSLDDAKKRIEHLRKINHKDSKASFRRKDIWKPQLGKEISPATAVFAAGLGSQSGPHGWEIQNTSVYAYLISYECEFCANGIIRFDIPDMYLDGFEGVGIVWSAMQGLYNPEAILWEACPFSWLVDYFASEKAKLLHKLFDMSPLPDAVLLQSGCSIKIKAKWGFTQKKHRFSMVTEETFSDEENYLGTATHDYYCRVPGLPTEEGFSGFRFPDSWNQLANILAILLGLRKKK